MQGKGDAVSMYGVAGIVTVSSSRDSVLETMLKAWENLQKMMLRRDSKYSSLSLSIKKAK